MLLFLLKSEGKMKNNFKKVFNFLLRHKISTLGVILTMLLVSGGLIYYSVYRKSSAWEKARSYYQAAEYVKAAEELKKVSFPSTVEELEIYSETMFAVGNYEVASKGYEKIYEINKDPNAMNMIGNIANQQKNYEKTVESYKSVIANNPNYIKSYVNLATAYRIKGDINNAINTTKEGIVNNPSNAELRVLLVSIMSSNEELKKTSDFREAVDKLKEIDPKNPILTQIEG